MIREALDSKPKVGRIVQELSATRITADFIEVLQRGAIQVARGREGLDKKTMHILHR